jgi:hypothetical protein
LAAVVPYPNLAKFKKHLDEWADEYDTDLRRRDRTSRARLPEPVRDAQEEARIIEGFRKLSDHLKRGFSPSTAE